MSRWRKYIWMAFTSDSDGPVSGGIIESPDRAAAEADAFVICAHDLGITKEDAEQNVSMNVLEVNG